MKTAILLAIVLPLVWCHDVAEKKMVLRHHDENDEQRLHFVNPFTNSAVRIDQHQHNHHHPYDEHDHPHEHDEHMHFQDHRHLLDHGHRCGTADPTRQQAATEEVRMKARLDGKNNNNRHVRQLALQTCDQLANQGRNIVIPANLHLTTVSVEVGNGRMIELIPHPLESVSRLLDGDETLTPSDFSSQADIEQFFAENLNIVNAAFQGTPFRFTKGTTTRTMNTRWSLDVGAYMPDLSALVGSYDLRELDVFLGVQLFANRTEGGVALGVARLAGSQLAGKGDGVAMRYDVLAGGGLTSADLGYTLVHEIGHWLGLLHTFNIFLAATADDPCNQNELDFNDFVDDTPMHSGASSSTLDATESCVDYLNSNTPLPDTCPDLPGDDPFFNYMNYLDDDLCYDRRGEFTCGQIERMHLHWELFRNAVTTCADPVNEVEIELVFVVDTYYVDDITQIVLVNDDTEQVLFDSVDDHLLAYALYSDEISTLEIDLCVPRNQNYAVGLVDINGSDGFADGSLSIYLDGVLFRTIDSSDGDFGNGRFFDIPASATTYTPPAPTPRPTPIPSSRPTTPPNLSPGSAPSTSQDDEPTNPGEGGVSASNQDDGGDKSNGAILAVLVVVVLSLVLISATALVILCRRSRRKESKDADRTTGTPDSPINGGSIPGAVSPVPANGNNTFAQQIPIHSFPNHQNYANSPQQISTGKNPPRAVHYPQPTNNSQHHVGNHAKISKPNRQTISNNVVLNRRQEDRDGFDC